MFCIYFGYYFVHSSFSCGTVGLSVGFMMVGKLGVAGLGGL